jgi:hypothetical protein
LSQQQDAPIILLALMLVQIAPKPRDITGDNGLCSART